jgi:MOSC domain-containing protein YiiM
MKVLQVSLGDLQPLSTSRGLVPSGIVKTRVDGKVWIGRAGLKDDRQADKEHHGGVNKAVYLFPIEQYPRYAEFLSMTNLPLGYFGENLTSEGVNEEELCIGDSLQIGGVELMVRSPRLPCYKFAAHTGNVGAAKFMLDTGMTGVYLSVESEGFVEGGDVIKIRRKPSGGVSVAMYVAAMMQKLPEDAVKKVVAEEALPSDRKELLLARIKAKYDGST